MYHQILNIPLIKFIFTPRSQSNICNWDLPFNWEANLWIYHETNGIFKYGYVSDRILLDITFE